MRDYQSRRGCESGALEDLIAFLQQDRPDGREGRFEDYERELHERTCAVEREALARELTRYDLGDERIEVAGKQYRRKLTSSASYLTQVGEVRVERRLYVPSSGPGRAICPLELRAGIVAGYWSPRAAKISTLAVGQMTPKECAGLFAELGGMQPSTSSLDRLPKVVSEEWERNREQFEQELRMTETSPQEATAVAISIDGVQALMKDEGRVEKRSQPDKQPKGPAGFREVGCGTISLLDFEGNRLQTYKYSRMPEAGKESVKSWLLEEARSLLVSQPGLEVIFLSDGAPDLWTFADDLESQLGIEDMHRALDAYHALERLKQALDAFYGEGSAKGRGLFQELRQRLCDEEDGVDAVLRALRYRRDRSRGPAKAVINCQIRYFEKHRDKMCYAELRKRNLPIGSGVVEATCKTLVTQRMKRSGMSWREPGGQAILTVRSLVQSNRWQRGWDLVAAQFRKQVNPAA